ncbi:MAG: hypothetical protein ACRDSK_20880 [Actinophytocola sp.]|uniref:hypothetical protein n=1 Tax=Actinophytocola sp. TaxID=1872138 RepID=UPI003D6BA9AC
MRLIRLGGESSEVGADVRAALASWGRGEGVVGGVALLGCQPAGDSPVDAIVLLPRGVLVVVGVDLPDPAVRLEAPLSAQWKTDGWPLVRPDGAVNPASEVMETVATINRHLEEARVEPLPVGTVIAVGPYVSKVEQPTSDLLRGVRVLHPEPMTLLTAARELATHPRPCTVAQARAILTALEPDNTTIAALDLEAEGFTDTVQPDLSAASTMVIPKIIEPRQPRPTRPARAGSGSQLRWLPVGAAVLVAMLLLTGIVFAVASAGDTDEGDGRTESTQQRGDSVEINGVAFAPKGSTTDTDCAEHAYGDVQVYLRQNRCEELVRMRFESKADGKTAAILVSVLRFQQSGSATDLNQLVDRPGSGAIVDPSAEGEAWPGEHKPFFESAAYASGREGNSLKLVQAVWIGAPSTPDDANLVKLADAALNLTAP